MVKLLAERAPAKCNLFLRVVGRRPDGYHQLDSVFVPITLCDRIALETRPSRASSIGLRCDRTDLPSGEGNLAWRAAAAFMAEFGIAAEVLIDLKKRIPAGAGLGGGSSDAGAVLRVMAAIYRIDSAGRMAKVALGLGADVPFFLNPRPARVLGIGEKIEPLESFPALHLVLGVPPAELSTAAIFNELSPEQWSGPAPEADLQMLRAGRIEPAMLVNDLESVAMRRCPEIAQLKAILKELGAGACAMTGSGSAVFGIFASAEAAGRAAERAASLAPASRFLPASTL